MTDVVFTAEACKACTWAQLNAISYMADSEYKSKIQVTKGGFDLPTGYLAFRTDYLDGSSIYGGIAPNGDVST